MTKGYVITALAKLAVRLHRQPELQDCLQTLRGSTNLDVQQRAGEMSVILGFAEVCEDILAPVDQPGEAGPIVVTHDDGDGDDLLNLVEEPLAVPAAPPAKSDLLSLIDAEIGVAAPAQQQHQQQQAPKLTPPPPGAVEALRKPDYVMYFEVRKNPQNLRQIAVRASFFNLGAVPLNRFAVKYGVPVGWNIQTQPATGSVLEPIGGAPIFQQFVLFTQGNVPLAMKAQISYVYGSQPIVETGEINSIFG
jgi:hypothetical protein